ncbi:uncharacterized protein LOC106707889 [Papilio machaon]|uniref:uncharacterized protein LOC106707889 n=1 Tax=Papilio machaon TaxID=76193 RepID=UPI001E664C05|nr:uncharacterized protein LOC106707889 [Papilio machaon]
MRRAGRADPFICVRLFCFCASIAISAAIKYGVPIEINHWETGRSPLKQMVDVTNEFGLKVLAEHNFLNDNNIAFSPYGLMGIMVALYEGVDGDSSYEIQRAMQLPWNRNVMRVGFRDIHRTLKTYFVPEEGFLAGLALNSENVIFKEKYKEVLRFYGFDIDSGQTTTPTSTTTNATVTTNPTSTDVDETSTTTLSTENTTTEKEETTTNPTETPTTEVTQETTTMSTQTIPTSTTVKTTTSQTTQTSVNSTTTTDSSTATTPNTTMSENIISTTESMATGTTNTATTGAITSTSGTDAPSTVTTFSSGSTTNTQNTSTSESVTNPTVSSSTSGSTQNVQNIATTESATPSNGTTSSSGTTAQNSSTSESPTSSTETSSSGSTTSMTMPGSVTTSTEATATSETTTVMQNTSTTENVTLSTEAASSSESTTSMQNTTTPGSVMPSSETMSTSGNIMNNTESVTNPTPVNGSLLETLARRKKSIVDYLFTNPPYADNYPVYRSFDIGPDFSDMAYDGDEQEVYFANDGKKILPYVGYGGNQMFLANGIKNVEVTYMSYDATLDHAHLPHLDASALRLPLDSERYYLLLVLPTRRRAGELARLLARMARSSDLSDVYNALRPKRVRALVPSFFVKGHITLTTDLQRLGIRNVFQPRQNDFTPMTSQAGVYVRSIEQSVSVSIRKYSPDETKKIGHAANRQRAYFSATYPFLYFVMDANINVALMAGKLVDPLNSRIL